jgi:hypothetical protein
MVYQMDVVFWMDVVYQMDVVFWMVYQMDVVYQMDRTIFGHHLLQLALLDGCQQCTSSCSYSIGFSFSCLFLQLQDILSIQLGI